jgi:hypothetical protein
MLSVMATVGQSKEGPYMSLLVLLLLLGGGFYLGGPRVGFGLGGLILGGVIIMLLMSRL